METKSNIVCPRCGLSFDASWHASGLAKACAFFGSDYPRVTAYLDLFRRAPGAQMNLSKRLRLLREVAKIIQDEGFDFNRSRHGIDRYAALTCMDIAVERLTCGMRQGCGLTNHNYWKQVMRSRGPEIMAERREKESQEKEQKLMSGKRAGLEPAPTVNIPLPTLKSIDAPPDVMDRVQAAGREILNLIHSGEHRPEMAARVCRKHKADPARVHEWIMNQGGTET